MTRDEFFADPIARWFYDPGGYIEPEWFAEAWRRNADFRDAATCETRRYIWKLGIIIEPGLLSMMARALTREEVLNFYEELRRKGRVMEWGPAFEKAVAPMQLLLPVSASDLTGVGDSLHSAIRERDTERVRFLARCMREIGLDPAEATYEEIDCGLSGDQIATLSAEEMEQLVERIETFPVQHLSVVEFAEALGYEEIVEIIRSGRELKRGIP
jgi:hypothetical protein